MREAERPLDVDAIVGEIDAAWSQWDVWIHRETGEVYVQFEPGTTDEESEAQLERLIDSGKLIRWDEEEWEDNRRAERFIGGLADGVVATRLAAAWGRRRRGRWRRFKAALNNAGLLEEWYGFRRACLRASVVRLLEVEGVPFRERDA